jgi:hypothetical protein
MWLRLIVLRATSRLHCKKLLNTIVGMGALPCFLRLGHGIGMKTTNLHALPVTVAQCCILLLQAGDHKLAGKELCKFARLALVLRAITCAESPCMTIFMERATHFVLMDP